MFRMQRPLEKLIHTLYYYVKPCIPRSVQIIFRSRFVLKKRHMYRSVWPIDERAGSPPEGWRGWPDQKRFALVLTHDVESTRGLQKCYPLIEMEQHLGFRSSFNFVPEKYSVPPSIRQYLVEQGCEVGVHGVRHDGNPFRSRRVFERDANRINHYLKAWSAVGFRSPSMYHNLDWIHDLNLAYDASTFDTDPFEPQPDGVGTVFPFWVSGGGGGKGYAELPYTLPQDFTLFVLMREKGIRIWKEKLDWIVQKGGMALLITHPDYMKFEDDRLSCDEYPGERYAEFLTYVKRNYEGQYWHVLPRTMAEFCAGTAAG